MPGKGNFVRGYQSYSCTDQGPVWRDNVMAAGKNELLGSNVEASCL